MVRYKYKIYIKRYIKYIWYKYIRYIKKYNFFEK